VGEVVTGVAAARLGLWQDLRIEAGHWHVKSVARPPHTGRAGL